MAGPSVSGRGSGAQDRRQWQELLPTGVGTERQRVHDPIEWGAHV